MSPEQEARAEIDRLLTAAGWHVCDYKAADLHAARGVAICEFELVAGHVITVFPRSLDGRVAGLIESKKKRASLTSVEIQLAANSHGVPVAPDPSHYPLRNQWKFALPDTSDIERSRPPMLAIGHTVTRLVRSAHALNRLNPPPIR